MTEQTIEMNFRQTIRQAAQLEEEAAQVRRVADQQLADAMQTLNAGWTGETAAVWQAKCSQLCQALRQSAAQLERSAEAMRRSAQRLYDAEQEALRLAEERKAGE